MKRPEGQAPPALRIDPRFDPKRLAQDPQIQSAARAAANFKAGVMDRSQAGRIFQRALSSAFSTSFQPFAQLANVLATEFGIDSQTLNSIAQGLQVPPPESSQEAILSIPAKVGGAIAGFAVPGSAIGLGAKAGGAAVGKLAPALGRVGRIAGGLTGASAAGGVPAALQEGETPAGAAAAAGKGLLSLPREIKDLPGAVARLIQEFPSLNPTEKMDRASALGESAAINSMIALGAARAGVFRVKARTGRPSQLVDTRGRSVDPATLNNATFVRQFRRGDDAVKQQMIPEFRRRMKDRDFRERVNREIVRGVDEAIGSGFPRPAPGAKPSGPDQLARQAFVPKETQPIEIPSRKGPPALTVVREKPVRPKKKGKPRVTQEVVPEEQVHETGRVPSERREPPVREAETKAQERTAQRGGEGEGKSAAEVAREQAEAKLAKAREANRIAEENLAKRKGERRAQEPSQPVQRPRQAVERPEEKGQAKAEAKPRQGQATKKVGEPPRTAAETKGQAAAPQEVEGAAARAPKALSPRLQSAVDEATSRVQEIEDTFVVKTFRGPTQQQFAEQLRVIREVAKKHGVPSGELRRNVLFEGPKPKREVRVPAARTAEEATKFRAARGGISVPAGRTKEELARVAGGGLPASAEKTEPRPASQAPKAPETTQAKGARKTSPAFERTTPRGTSAEGQRIKERVRRTNDQLDALFEKLDKAKKQRNAVRDPASKRAVDLEERQGRLQKQIDALTDKTKPLFQQQRRMILEDIMERGDEANRLAAEREIRLELDADKIKSGAERRHLSNKFHSEIKDLAVAEARKQGVPADDVEFIANDAVSSVTSVPGNKTLFQAVDVAVRVTKRQRGESADVQAVQSMTHLSSLQRKNALRLLDRTLNPEERAKVVKEAKDANESSARLEEFAKKSEERSRKRVAAENAAKLKPLETFRIVPSRGFEGNAATPGRFVTDNRSLIDSEAAPVPKLAAQKSRGPHTVKQESAAARFKELSASARKGKPASVAGAIREAFGFSKGEPVDVAVVSADDGSGFVLVDPIKLKLLRRDIKPDAMRIVPADSKTKALALLKGGKPVAFLMEIRKPKDFDVDLPGAKAETAPKEKAPGGSSTTASIGSGLSFTEQEVRSYLESIPDGEANPFEPHGSKLKPPRGGFGADLMAAAKALAVPVKSAKLRGLMIGVFRPGRRRDIIELSDIRWSVTLSHELGHAVDYRLNGNKFPSSIRKRFPGLKIKERQARTELKRASEIVRPGVQWNVRSNETRYRARHTELMADLFALISHDMDAARKAAPNVTSELQTAINGNDAVKAATDKVFSPELAGPVPPAPIEPSGRESPFGDDDPVGRALSTPDIASREIVEEMVTDAFRRRGKELFRVLQIARSWRRLLSERELHDVGALVEKIGNFKFGGTFSEVRARASAKVRKILREYEFNQELNRQEVNRIVREVSSGEFIRYIEDYLGHFYKGKRKILQFAAKWSKQTPATKKRVFPTLADAAKAGLEPLTQDVSFLFEKTAEQNFKAALTRRFIGKLKDLRHTITGEPLIVASLEKAGSDWVRVEHSAMRRVFATKNADGSVHLWHNFAYVHPSIARPIEVMLGRPFRGNFARAMTSVNTGGKMLAVALSFFHGLTLIGSGQAFLGRAYNPIRGLMIGPFESKKLGFGFKPVFAWQAGLKSAEKDPLGTADGIAHGLNLGVNASMDQARTQMDRLLSEAASATEKIPDIGLLVKGLARTQQALNKLVWDNIHIGLKLFAYHMAVAEALGKAPAGWSIKSIKETVASSVNNAFGGQEFLKRPVIDLAGTGSLKPRIEPLTPKEIQIAHWGVFAPDWTYSNIAVAGQPIVDFKNPTSRRLGLRYWRNTLIGLTLGVAAIQRVLWQLFHDDDKDYQKFSWQNKGDGKWNLDVTPIARALPWNDPEDKSRHYVGFGKQAKEVLGYFEEFPKGLVRTIGGKMSVLGRTTVEQVSGHTAGSGFPMPWSRDRERLNGWGEIVSRAKAVGENFVPFSFTASNFAFSLPQRKGATPYKVMRWFQQAIENQVDPSLFQKAKKRAGWDRAVSDVLRDIVETGRVNGMDHGRINRLYLTARSKVRSEWYDKFWSAIERKDGPGTEEAAKTLRALGATSGTLKASGKRRGKRLPQGLSPIRSIKPISALPRKLSPSNLRR